MAEALPNNAEAHPVVVPAAPSSPISPLTNRILALLPPAEAEHFFEQQLVKHKLPAEWAQDMTFAYRDSTAPLTIAQWRYCAWAAVRRGASMALIHGLQFDGLRDSIYQEIRRRAASVSSGAWNNCSFPPHNPLPDNAMGRGFVGHVTGLGPLYWTGWPSVETLLGIELIRAQS